MRSVQARSHLSQHSTPRYQPAPSRQGLALGITTKTVNSLHLSIYYARKKGFFFSYFNPHFLAVPRCMAFFNIYFLIKFFSLTKRVIIFRFTQKVKNKKFNKKKPRVCWCYGVRLSASQCAGGVRWQAESSAATLRSLLCEDWSWCWYCWGLGGTRLTLILLCEEKY